MSDVGAGEGADIDAIAARLREIASRLRDPGLAEGEVFYHDLPGMQVFTLDGARVGEVSQVYELRPADLLEVRTERGTVLVPFVEPIVRELDVAGRRIVIDPPEGLLEP